MASPTEIALTSLWEVTLETNAIGLDDDFFMLGGDSLSAVRLLMSVEEIFGVNIPVERIFDDANTIARMAANIEGLRDGALNKTDIPPPRQPVDRSVLPATTLIDSADIFNAGVFALLFVAAALLPMRMWPLACRFVAALHIGLRGSRAAPLCHAISNLGLAMKPGEFERRSLADIYQEIIYTFRHRLPGGWRPRISLHGLEYIDAAVAKGRGAVLWSVPVTRGELAEKRAFHDAGHEVVYLRSAIHPYSGTRFGRRFLNPLRTRIEDRYMKDHVSLVDGEEAQAVYELVEMLRQNLVVRVAGIHGGSRPLQQPFYGGTLNLALGAPTLAVLAGAPLLPVYVVPGNGGEFDVWVKPPLNADGGQGAFSAEALARDYADVLRAYVAEHPTRWRGWSTPGQWSVS